MNTGNERKQGGREAQTGSETVGEMTRLQKKRGGYKKTKAVNMSEC